MQIVSLQSDQLFDALQFAVGQFAEFSIENGINAKTLRLGGGTALATLWGHRYSTDLDLVVDRDVFTTHMPHECKATLTRHLKAHKQAFGLSKIGFRSHMVYLKHQGVPVSLVPSRLDLGESAFSNIEIEGTGVRLARSEAILRGKIVGRFLENNTMTDRDGYDIAYALTHYPSLVMDIFNTLEYEDRTTLLTHMKDAAGSIGKGRAIQDASEPHIAQDPWTIAHELIRAQLAHGSSLDIGR